MSGSVRLLRLGVAAAMTAGLAIGATAAVAAQDDEAILQEMVALEESKLGPWYQNDASAYVAEIGDETTWFDTGGTLVAGDDARAWLQGLVGAIPPIDWAITNPAVAIRGDVVVFTYNIDMANPETGEPMGQWMTTKILERSDDGWEVIHGHMSMPAPPPPEEAPAA